MRFGYCSCGTLAAMAHGASELVEFVRDYGMRPEGLRAYIGEARLFHSNVATRAAVDHTELGQPDLLNPALKMALQCHGIAAVADHLQISVLIMTPFAEVVFRGGNRERSQKNQAHHAEGANAIPEQLLPQRFEFFFHERDFLEQIRTLATAT